MSDSSKKEGKCLCGAVSIRVEKTAHKVDACHCSMCRRWASAPFLALESETKPEITGGDKIKRFRSSAWAERAFCGDCGTNLFYRLVEPDQYVVSAGLFQDDADFEFTGQIFVDEKPAYYDFANKTSTMTGAEVFAKFAPKA